MDVGTLKLILEDETLSDNAIEALLLRAQKKAANHHFWRDTDVPTEEQLSAFYKRYEMEIYELAKAINSSDARDGQISHSELGISRAWGRTGKETIDDALSEIPPKTYVL